MKVQFMNTPRPVSEVQEKHISKLKEECGEAIVDRFSAMINGKEYFFSNDEKAQSNYEKFARALDKGLLTQVKLNAYSKDGIQTRLTFDRNSFDIVYKAHVKHIIVTLDKLHEEVIPQVKKLKSKKDILSIKF